MSQEPLKIGDIVGLKSGGPRMTVTNVGEYLGKQTIWCAWFDGTKQLDGTFPPEALKIVALTAAS